MIDATAFNFDAMKEAVGIDPFAADTNKYGADERFYKLTRDKEGNGGAIIRFLPDAEKGLIQKMFKINTTITKNGKKRFVSEYSPATIGQPCPFQEEWQKLWNSGDKEGAKLFGRGIKYVTNIKVLKDPLNPQNEGKIFLFEMSGSMKDKIQAAVNPSEQDRALGAQPKELFNPLAGCSFKLACKKGANGIISYDSSEVINEVNSIYDTVEAALEDIKSNTYKLSDMLKPEAFMSYDELVKKKAWVTFQDTEQVVAAPVTAEVAAPAAVQPEVTEAPATSTPEVEQKPTQPAQPAQAAPAAGNSLDDLLNGLM